MLPRSIEYPSRWMVRGRCHLRPLGSEEDDDQIPPQWLSRPTVYEHPAEHHLFSNDIILGKLPILFALKLCYSVHRNIDFIVITSTDCTWMMPEVQRLFIVTISRIHDHCCTLPLCIYGSFMSALIDPRCGVPREPSSLFVCSVIPSFICMISN